MLPIERPTRVLEIWLENPGCYATPQTWVTANGFTAQLEDGECGLTDGSRPGDWRLPTKEEWEGILDSSCTTQPEILGNQSPVPGCYIDPDDDDSEWATGVVEDSYWSFTTLFNHTVVEWSVSLGAGGFGITPKTESQRVWPVRGGPTQHERIRSVFCPTGEFVTGFDNSGDLLCDSIASP